MSIKAFMPSDVSTFFKTHMASVRNTVVYLGEASEAPVHSPMSLIGLLAASPCVESSSRVSAATAAIMTDRKQYIHELWVRIIFRLTWVFQKSRMMISSKGIELIEEADLRNIAVNRLLFYSVEVRCMYMYCTTYITGIVLQCA